MPVQRHPRARLLPPSPHARSVKREVKRQEEKASKKHERERARRAEEQATAEDL